MQPCMCACSRKNTKQSLHVVFDLQTFWTRTHTHAIQMHWSCSTPTQWACASVHLIFLHMHLLHVVHRDYWKCMHLSVSVISSTTLHYAKKQVLDPAGTLSTTCTPLHTYHLHMLRLVFVDYIMYSVTDAWRHTLHLRIWTQTQTWIRTKRDSLTGWWGKTVQIFSLWLVTSRVVLFGFSCISSNGCISTIGLYLQTVNFTVPLQQVYCTIENRS